MGAIRGQTSPRKGCVVSIARFPAFRPVTSQVPQHLSLAQKGQLQPATPGSTVDGGQELHTGTGPLEVSCMGRSPVRSAGLLAGELLEVFQLYPSLGGDGMLRVSGSHCSCSKAPAWLKQRHCSWPSAGFRPLGPGCPRLTSGLSRHCARTCREPAGEGCYSFLPVMAALSAPWDSCTQGS